MKSTLEKNKLIEQNVFREGEEPLLKRLVYKSLSENSSPLVTENNSETRNLIFSQISQDPKCWLSLKDVLDYQSSDDVLLAEIDRYGLPLRTVLNKNTGLVRSDPFYSEHYLNTFYSRHYRDLYSNRENLNRTSILTEQISRGEGYFQFAKEFLTGGGDVLEVGCGMGGILIPFKLNGFKVTGIDLGEEFIQLGNQLNLNLQHKTVDEVVSEGKTFDLIILSHLIEHIRDIEQFLQKVKSLLGPRGKLFIAVPGIKKIHETYIDFHVYLQNAHCWSFSQVTLSAVLERAGFGILRIDDYINCVAHVSNGDYPQHDLKKEGKALIDYIQNVENSFLKSNNGEVDFAKRLKFFLKSKLNRLRH